MAGQWQRRGRLRRQKGDKRYYVEVCNEFNGRERILHTKAVPHNFSLFSNTLHSDWSTLLFLRGCISFGLGLDGVTDYKIIFLRKTTGRHNCYFVLSLL